MVQNESFDDMSDCVLKKRKSFDREEQFEICMKGDVMLDILIKKRKMKRVFEVSCDRYLQMGNCIVRELGSKSVFIF